jgi:hypothetical protein
VTKLTVGFPFTHDSSIPLIAVKKEADFGSH